jgi:hypothetical protein
LGGSLFYYIFLVGVFGGIAYVAYTQREAVEELLVRFMNKSDKYRYGDLDRVPESAIDDYAEETSDQRSLMDDFDPRN